MKQTLFALNEIGKRKNNEDSIYPPKGTATEQQLFFLVCDGMGGHENGDVASRTVCESFAFTLKNIAPESFNEKRFQETLTIAYDALDEEDNHRGGKAEMGTTLTFLYLNNQQAFMAHIGDSRIYHLRKTENGKVEILHKTSDHSLVSELLQGGIITEEEAKKHPKKNVITRAMQPNQFEKKRDKADIHITQDVMLGDYFFLCTDGILESIDDEQLCNIIAENTDNATKMKTIQHLCEAYSRDNFSAYLISLIK